MVDERDLEIIAALQEDARATYADIGRRAGLSPSAVHERVRKLERTGAIRAYRAIVDPEALGLFVTALIAATRSIPRRPTTSPNARDFPEVVDCLSVAGEANYILKVRVRTTTASRTSSAPPREGRGEHHHDRGALRTLRGPSAPAGADGPADLAVRGRERGQTLERGAVAPPALSEGSARIQLWERARRDPEAPSAQTPSLGPEAELLQHRVEGLAAEEMATQIRFDGSSRSPSDGRSLRPPRASWPPTREPIRPARPVPDVQIGRRERREPDLRRSQPLQGRRHADLGRTSDGGLQGDRVGSSIRLA